MGIFVLSLLVTYVIFFRVIDDETIRVTVVKHEKRHPAFGMESH